MRRRLDLAAALVNRPQVLFLDEPTTGLDPRSRLRLWEVIEDLVRDGTTLLLTTQYLEEADRLADRIAVIDTGKVIAEGTSDELKDKVGGSVVVVRPADPADGEAALPRADRRRRAGARHRRRADPAGHHRRHAGHRGCARARGGRRRRVSELALRRPTLDDVFLTLTGHGAEDAPEEDA